MPNYLLPPPVATLLTTEWITLMMYAIGWTILVLLSHAIALTTGVWIGSSVIPWLRNRQVPITDGQPPVPRVMNEGPYESAVSANQFAEQQSENVANLSLPRWKQSVPVANMTNSPLPKLKQSLPDIFVDGSGRFHISPACFRAEGVVVPSSMQPCSKCTNSETFSNYDRVYCCMKGKKYHIGSCGIIKPKSRQDGGPNESRATRLMTACQCIRACYSSLSPEGHNYNVF